MGRWRGEREVSSHGFLWIERDGGRRVCTLHIGLMRELSFDGVVAVVAGLDEIAGGMEIGKSEDLLR